MQWSANASSANSMPNWRIALDVSNKISARLTTSAANTSVNSIPFTSTTGSGIGTGWFIYNNKQSLGVVSTINTTTITTVNNLPAGGVASGSNLTFTKVATNSQLFDNIIPSTSKGAKNSVIGVFGVTPLMANVSSAAGKKRTVPGWYVVKSGMGPSKNHVVTNGGTLYSNNDVVLISSTANGTINSSANVITNGSGVITSFSFPFSNNGGLFVNTSTTTQSITTSTGSSFTMSYALGGRAGRVKRECLATLNLNSVTLLTNAANTSSTVLPFASTTGVAVGQIVTAPGIPAGDSVASFTGTSVTLTNALSATVPSGTTISFT